MFSLRSFGLRSLLGFVVVLGSLPACATDVEEPSSTSMQAQSASPPTKEPASTLAKAYAVDLQAVGVDRLVGYGELTADNTLNVHPCRLEMPEGNGIQPRVEDADLKTVDPIVWKAFDTTVSTGSGSSEQAVIGGARGIPVHADTFLGDMTVHASVNLGVALHALHALHASEPSTTPDSLTGKADVKMTPKLIDAPFGASSYAKQAMDDAAQKMNREHVATLLPMSATDGTGCAAALHKLGL